MNQNKGYYNRSQEHSMNARGINTKTRIDYKKQKKEHLYQQAKKIYNLHLNRILDSSEDNRNVIDLPYGGWSKYLHEKIIKINSPDIKNISKFNPISKTFYVTFKNGHVTKVKPGLLSSMATSYV